MGMETNKVVRYKDIEEIEEQKKIDIISNADMRIVNVNSREISMDVRYQIWMDIVRRYRDKEKTDGVQKSER